MKEENMTEMENSQTSQLLGRLEVKMDNQEKSTSEVRAMVSENARRQDEQNAEVVKRLTKVEQQQAVFLAQITPRQHRWPAILMAILGCITAAAVVITLILTITKP
jgi:hypothetical protein